MSTESNHEVVTLKNGSQEALVAVNVMSMILRNLWDEQPILAYELVMKARDPQHVCFGTCGEELKRRSLLGSDGQLHDTTRNIIVSAVTGEGFDMVLGSPIAEGGQS